jgi:hypothetical protein
MVHIWANSTDGLSTTGNTGHSWVFACKDRSLLCTGPISLMEIIIWPHYERNYWAFSLPCTFYTRQRLPSLFQIGLKHSNAMIKQHLMLLSGRNAQTSVLSYKMKMI